MPAHLIRMGNHYWPDLSLHARRALGQPSGRSRTDIIAEIEPEIDIRSHNPDRATEIDIAGTGQPHLVRAHGYSRAHVGRHGARNPCPMCGRKNYRAGEVCQPDSSWPNGTYQWRCWGGTGVQYTDLRQTRRRLEPAHSPWSWRAVPRNRCEQPWPGLRIRLPRSAQPTRRSFWSFCFSIWWQKPRKRSAPCCEERPALGEISSRSFNKAGAAAVTSGDGGGHGCARMRQARNHKSRSGRRSK